MLLVIIKIVVSSLIFQFIYFIILLFSFNYSVEKIIYATLESVWKKFLYTEPTSPHWGCKFTIYILFYILKWIYLFCFFIFFTKLSLKQLLREPYLSRHFHWWLGLEQHRTLIPLFFKLKLSTVFIICRNKFYYFVSLNRS